MIIRVGTDLTASGTFYPPLGLKRLVVGPHPPWAPAKDRQPHGRGPIGAVLPCPRVTTHTVM